MKASELRAIVEEFHPDQDVEVVVASNPHFPWAIHVLSPAWYAALPGDGTDPDGPIVLFLTHGKQFEPLPTHIKQSLLEQGWLG